MTTGERKYPVGFIGIGKMGYPMASRIAAQGYPLHVYDISAAALAVICSQTDARAEKTPADIGRNCEAVILMLPDSAVVKKVLFGGSGALTAHLLPGSVVIDMSSSDPSVTREIGPRLKQAGADFIDAPVSGGVKRAIDGSLAIMAGGDGAVIARVKPLLSAMGKSIIETGMLGSGHAMKALNNYVSAAGLLAACEALKVGVDFGIAPDKIIAVLNASTGKNNSTENKLMQYIVSRLFNSGFSLGLMRKDINIATDLAKTTGSRTLLGEVLLKSWKDAEKKLGAAADHTAIFQMLDSE
ncbi:MAG: NAD(P)-dependent oxidoreductase [Deltaproteobacteria bacterium]|nr:NAD(P)-dependent oxidoreductase [Deltaproteobacteria bacterium]MDA8125668.1 NAD(P)-dependent oxidoreductase [Deltaproteobacteria bacterium]